MEQNILLPRDVTCGYFDCSEFAGMAVSPKRTVTRFEIEYYLEDGLSTYTDGIEYPIRKDHIRIALPGQQVHSRLPFCTLFLKFTVEGSLTRQLADAPTCFPSVNSSKIKDVLREMIMLYGETDRELFFYSKMFETLHLILGDSRLSDTAKNANPFVAETAKKFMDENFSRAISLGDIAAAVSLSPIYFHNIFKATCHMTPHEYLVARRISAAKEMLWDTRISISDVAQKCGFGCQQYLSDVFKKQLGTTPGRYRKCLQKNYLL